MEKEMIHSVLCRVAHDNGVPVEEVYREIEKVIDMGIGSRNLLIRSQWEQIPRRGEVPTVEELVIYLLRKEFGC